MVVEVESFVRCRQSSMLWAGQPWLSNTSHTPNDLVFIYLGHPAPDLGIPTPQPYGFTQYNSIGAFVLENVAGETRFFERIPGYTTVDRVQEVHKYKYFLYSAVSPTKPEPCPPHPRIPHHPVNHSMAGRRRGHFVMSRWCLSSISRRRRSGGRET